MIKKLGFFMLCSFLFLSLTSCTVMHFVKAKFYLESGQYEEAIIECEEALKTNQGNNLFKIIQNGVSVNADYLSTMCLGASYQATGNFEKSAKYWHMNIDIFPERAFFGYLGLSELYYQNGKLEDAYEYGLKAKESVNSPSYYRLQSKSVYDVDLWKNAVIAASEFYELRLNFLQLEKEYELKNYNKTAQLAGEILKKNIMYTLVYKAVEPHLK